MTLEALHNLWNTESQIDFSQPDSVIRNIPILHHQWWQRYTTERLQYVAVKQEYDKLRHKRMEWYTGRLDDVERKNLGWDPQPLRLVRGEVDAYLNADPLLFGLQGKVETQETKLKFLEDVIKQVNQRSFLVKNWIEWQRFSQGQ